MNNAIALTGGAAFGFLFLAIIATSWPLFFIAVFLGIVSFVLNP